ncbi:MAG: Nudix family hydrolase [Thiohalocapsa sp.]
MSGAAAMERPLIHVAAGAVVDQDGRILIAKRPDRAHQGGLWEFPGGKLEPGERPSDGLARELYEELGIRIDRWRPLIRVQHDYGDRRVLLDVYRVDAYVGIPQGREGQPLAWVEPEQMDSARFPAADRPIINALRLPSLYLITGDDPADTEGFLMRLARALDTGIELVQLRAHGLSDSAYRRLAQAVYPLCREARARLLLNRAPNVVRDLPCDGVHLGSALLRELRERPCPTPHLVGASCHSAEELRLAAGLGLDYALLSPVEATLTHPGATTLGWSGFAELTAMACLPVYALGGLGPAERERCFEQGGQGIAAIRGLWPG